MRENGYYWIKIEATDDWEPAEWYDGDWWFIASEMELSQVAVVGDRAYPPGETNKEGG